MISGILTRWGADPQQFHLLLRVSLLSEWRQQKSAGSKKRSIPLVVRSLLFYLIMGFSLGISLITRVTPVLYTLFCYSYFMMMTGFAVIVECSQVLLNPDDMDILVHRPVSSRTVFLARFTHLLIFILMFSLILCVGPTLISLFFKDVPRTFSLVFGLSALLSVIFSAAFMMLIYTFLLRLMRFKRLKPMIFIFQLIMTLSLIFMYQFIARSGWESAAVSFKLSDSWMLYTPPGWFTAIADAMLHPFSHAPLLMAAAGLIVSGILFRIGLSQLSLSYLHDVSHAGVQNLDSAVRLKRSFSLRRVSGFVQIRDPETRAGFFLALNLLKRDRAVQMGILPMLAIPLMVLAWGVVDGEVVDPFLNILQFSKINSQQLLPFFIMFFIFMTVKGAAYSRDWEARWIFYSAPLLTPSRLVSGAQAGLLSGVGLPFFLLLFLILSTQFMWLHAFQYLIYLVFIGMTFLGFLNLEPKEIPFSKKRERGERIGGFSFFLILIPFQAGALFLHRYAYSNQKSWWIALAGLGCLIMILKLWGGKRKIRAIE